jgi:hypothetical protein
MDPLAADAGLAEEERRASWLSLAAAMPQRPSARVRRRDRRACRGPEGPGRAAVIAIAERLNLTEVATVDRKHFSIVRPRHVPAFRLHPEAL